jgi:hypothetical protein
MDVVAFLIFDVDLLLPLRLSLPQLSTLNYCDGDYLPPICSTSSAPILSLFHHGMKSLL